MINIITIKQHPLHTRGPSPVLWMLRTPAPNTGPFSPAHRSFSAEAGGRPLACYRAHGLVSALLTLAFLLLPWPFSRALDTSVWWHTLECRLSSMSSQRCHCQNRESLSSPPPTHALTLDPSCLRRWPDTSEHLWLSSLSHTPTSNLSRSSVNSSIKISPESDHRCHPDPVHDRLSPRGQRGPHNCPPASHI